MKTKQKKIITSVLACILIMMIPISGLAHSGRTDSSGGHKDNKNKSGLGYYHYHCGGYPPHLHPIGMTATLSVSICHSTLHKFFWNCKK